MKPVCVKCHRFFRVKKNGFYFIEGMPGPGRPLPVPGLDEAHRWQPYKLWVGDLYAYEGCGAEILSGFGSGPIAEHYQPTFKAQVAGTGADQLQVNDC